MAELVDALDLGSSFFADVGVQVPSTLKIFLAVAELVDASDSKFDKF